jgi:hypothetical protein
VLSPIILGVSTAAGWYPDPTDPHHDRFWDGATWTDHRHPRVTQPMAYVAPTVAPTHGPATTSLVLGILAVVAAGFLTGIPAMVIGRRAQREIDASGGRLGGRGSATAGFVTGLIGTIWSGFVFLLVVAVFAFGAALSDSFEDTCTTVNSDGSSSPNC